MFRVTTSPLILDKGKLSHSENMGFRIEFHFGPNEHFENEVLYKVSN
jgi:hypothetical protein